MDKDHPYHHHHAHSDQDADGIDKGQCTTELDLSIVIEKSLVHTGQDQHGADGQQQKDHEKRFRIRSMVRFKVSMPLRSRLNAFSLGHTFFTAR